MSDDIKPSVPTTLAADVHEIQAIFGEQDRFDEAMDRLRMAGFDRAALNVPAATPHAGAATPEAGAANPDTPIDRQQIRTLAGSTAGVTAAMIGAGVTVATGGAAALAAGIAVAAGALVGGATHAATAVGTSNETEARDAKADRGTLVLAVVVRDEAEAARATETLHACGALRVETVTRTGATVPAPVGPAAA